MIPTRIKQLVLSLSFMTSLGLVSCRPVDLLNLTISRKRYSIFYNLAYGTLTRQKLDIYVPEQLSKPTSTIIFFYGGSWQFGDKNIYRFLGQAFASQGFITVVINYRLFPEVYFPSFMEDAAKALHWVHCNIHQYGGDPGSVFLAGHSAGAHIATLLATDGHFIKDEGGNLSWIKGVIGIAGPYNFLPFTDPKIKELFSKVPEAQTQPIHFVTQHLAPFLLVTGVGDKGVAPQNTANFARRLRQAKVPVTEIIYPKVGHIGIILSLATMFRYKVPLLKDISQFIIATNEIAAEANAESE